MNEGRANVQRNGSGWVETVMRGLEEEVRERLVSRGRRPVVEVGAGRRTVDRGKLIKVSEATAVSSGQVSQAAGHL